MSFVVGIDGGTQSTKVVVYDLRGRVVAEGHQALRPMSMPAPGHVEHPDDDLWDSLVMACRKAMAALPGDRREIVGVGLCSIRFCRAVLDGERLAAPVQSWMDERVSRPWVRTLEEVSLVTTASGYLTVRMTGERRDTAANYRDQWPVNLDTWDWSQGWATDPSSYDGGDLTREVVSDLVLPGEVLGRLTEAAAAATGLPVDVPVVATANDKAVEALGSGVVAPGTALLSLGTYIGAMVVGDRPHPGAAASWTNFACIPRTYLLESGGIRRGMWTVSWLRDLFERELTDRARTTGRSVEQVLNDAAAEVPIGSDGLLTLLDWLPTTDAPHRRGAMVGFDQRHGWPQMYRSVLEGIAMTMRTHLAAMCAELGRDVTDVVVAGGGSHADLMMQLLADVLGVPTRRYPSGSAAGRGAAMCALAATTGMRGPSEAVDQLLPAAEQFDPVPAARSFYDALHDVYATLPARLDPVLAAAHELPHPPPRPDPPDPPDPGGTS